MDIIKVEKLKTQLTAGEAFNALKQAWAKKFGGSTDRQVAILTAQWAQETGWGNSMFNYNFAGIKGANPVTGETVEYGTTEGYGKSKESTVDGFRAYRTAVEGAEDYIDLLDRRYPNAVKKIKEEDPVGYVNEVKGVYFSDDPKIYLKNIISIASKFADYSNLLPKKKVQVAKKENIGAKPKKQQVKKVTQQVVSKKKSQKKPIKRTRADAVLEISDKFLKLAKS